MADLTHFGAKSIICTDLVRQQSLVLRVVLLTEHGLVGCHVQVVAVVQRVLGEADAAVLGEVTQHDPLVSDQVVLLDLPGDGHRVQGVVRAGGERFKRHLDL